MKTHKILSYITLGTLLFGISNIMGIAQAAYITRFSASSIISGTNNQVLVTSGSTSTWALIAADNIASNAVTTAKINALAVTDAKLAANSVIEAKIANSAVTTAKINDLAVTEAKLAASAVTNGKIANGAVDANKLASNAVTTVKILDANVTTAKIANGAVTTTKIDSGANNTVLTTNGSGTVTWEARANFASSTLTSGNIFVGNVSNIATSVPLSGHATISNTGVLTLADNAVTTAKINALAVTDAKLAANSVIEAKIANSAVTTAKINDLAVTEAKLAASAVTNGKIANSAVDANKLASNAVTTAKILDANVTTAKIANDAVTAAKIGTAGAGDANKILTTDGSGNPQWETKTSVLASTSAIFDVQTSASTTWSGMTISSPQTMLRPTGTTTGPTTVTLPTCGGSYQGFMVTVKGASTITPTNTLTVTPADITVILTEASNSVDLVCDTSTWYVK